jgi:hypothetical protein
MSGTIGYYGGIITENLLSFFDAGRQDSLNRNGTTWNSLRRNDTVVGTLTNGAVFEGIGGGSVLFDGNNDWVSLINGVNTYNPIALSLNWTVYAWIRINANKANPILDDRTGGPAILGLRVDLNGKMEWIQYDSQWNTYTSTGTTVPLQTWSHVAYTMSSSNTGPGKMYLNGSLNHTINVSSPRLIGYGNMTHLGRSWSGGSFNGNISMLMVYTAEHSATQVLQMYNTQKSRFGLP